MRWSWFCRAHREEPEPQWSLSFLSTGGWVTRFSQTGAQENFQLENGAPVRVPMMQQDNYPVKMGVDSDLRCTVSVVAQFVTNKPEECHFQRIRNALAFPSCRWLRSRCRATSACSSSSLKTWRPTRLCWRRVWRPSLSRTSPWRSNLLGCPWLCLSWGSATPQTCCRCSATSVSLITPREAEKCINALSLPLWVLPSS